VRDWASANGVAYHHEPIPAASGAQLAELTREARTPDAANASMVSTYRWIVDRHGAQIANTLGVVAGGTPAGFGCAAGRDRTGIVTAFMHALLGVPDNLLVRSYMSHAPRPEQLRELARAYFGIGPDDPLPGSIETILAPRAEWITETLDHVRRGYGDIQGYLAAHGLDAEAQDALGRRLIADATDVAA
jgi:protein tyrosine/serine phosphatase